MIDQATIASFTAAPVDLDAPDESIALAKQNAPGDEDGDLPVDATRCLSPHPRPRCHSQSAR